MESKLKNKQVMKRRIGILAVLGLLAVVGVWWHGRPQPLGGGAQRAGAGVKLASAPVVAAVTAANGSAPAAAKAPVASTNRLAYRLSNTTNTLRQLQAKPHAILLANALIDTDRAVDLRIPPALRSAGDPGAYIVEARGPIGAAFRSALARAGAAIVSYIPNNAYLVDVAGAGAGQLAADPSVQVVLPYEPYYKLQSSLLGLAVNGAPLPPGTALTLGLFGADAAAMDELRHFGIPILQTDQSPFGPMLTVLAPADWTALAQLKGVQYVEVARHRQAANDLARVSLGVSADTQVPADYLNLYGSNVLVAVNDSGVDRQHPDFTTGGAAGGTPGGAPVRVEGLTPLDLVDTNGHGTHVAGIIAGNGAASWGGSYIDVGDFAEGSISDADYRGKAPLAWLFSVNDAHYTDYQLQTNAALAGALISNNSWDYGNGDAEYDLAAASYDFATRDAVPGQPGSQPVLFVFAAGNEGGGADDGTGGASDTILSPGTAKNVLTVGALEQPRNITNIVTTITAGTGTNGPTTNTVAYWQAATDTSDQVAAYSSRGNVGVGTEGNAGRFKPDVVAPGTFVVSTSSQFNQEWNTNAYYNPTNDTETVYTDQVAETNALNYYDVQVPADAVGVRIRIYANEESPSPFPSLVIYCQQSGYPDPTNDASAIDLTTYTNGVDMPPGGGKCTLPSLRGNGFNFAVGVTNNEAVNYDLTVELLTTNNVGDRYAVLEGMNNRLGGYYRYESGTSLAAAGISGLLALIQDYFTNQFKPALIPSPALLKALVINGARTSPAYELAFTNAVNFEGWGEADLENSVPAGGLFDQTDGTTQGSTFFVEQNAARALATGDSHTYFVAVNTNQEAENLYLQATLVWTDPPGDPAAAIKLVNNLDLVVTNLDTGDVNYQAVYVGNDLEPDLGYNLPEATNKPANYDTINNVENVILAPALGGRYSVTVVGRGVNVNAVTAQSNNIVQDFALVIAIGEGEVTNAFSVTDGGVASNATGDQDVTAVLSTNAPLTDQLVGASSPLLGTNQLSLGTATGWGAGGGVDDWADQPVAFLRGDEQRIGGGLHERGVFHVCGEHAVAAADGGV
jgi:subtilisin family serine protease